MTEYWQRSIVSGGDAEKIEHLEVVLHRRGDDPVVMACRRNLVLAGCSVIRVDTAEAFQVQRKDDTQKKKADIPQDRIQTEVWDW